MYRFLGDRVGSPCLRLLMHGNALSEAIKGELAGKSFLEIVSLRGITAEERECLLRDLCLQYGLVREKVSDQAISDAFFLLLRESLRQGDFVSPAEMHWINNYVDNLEIRLRMEEAIYYSLLFSSDNNPRRRHFGWSFGEDSFLRMARLAIANEDLPLERRLEIAHEFGEPCEDLTRRYYRYLIESEDYEQLGSLGDDMEDVVVSVVLSDVNRMMFDEALAIICFLIPHRQDIYAEVEAIKEAFRLAKRTDSGYMAK